MRRAKGAGVIAVMRNSGNTNDAAGNDRLAAAKANITSWLITAALSLSIGLVVLGGLTAAAAMAAGSLNLAHDACQGTETALASDLGVGVATLRTIAPTDLTGQIAARQAAGILTAAAALQATDRATSYATCRQVFGQTSPTTPVTNR